MTGHLDKAENEITCPECKRKTKKSVVWVKNNSKFACVCGHNVTLDASQFKSEISEAEGAIAEFKKNLKKFNK